MKENLKFADSAECLIERAATNVIEQFSPKGKYVVEMIRDNEVVHTEEIENLVTTVGKNSILDTAFRNQAVIATWYLGLVDLLNYSTQAQTDTMSAHAGWQEWTAYTEANRQAWTPSAAANASITNPTPATFNINASGTLAGLFLTSSNTKGGTTGVLWSVVTFGSSVPVQNGDQIKVTYTLAS